MKTLLYVLTLFFFIISNDSHARQQERRIAACNYHANNGVFIPTDSVIYMYTGTRGVDSSWGPAQAYDTSYAWTYRSAAGIYTNPVRYIQAYDAADKPIETITQHWDSVAGRYFDYQYTVDSYSVDHFPLRAIIQNYDTASRSLTNYQMTTKGYDNLNRLIVQVNFNWNSVGIGFWDTANVYTGVYNASGQFISAHNYITRGPYFSQVSQYSYDSLGRIDTAERIVTFGQAASISSHQKVIDGYDQANNLVSEVSYDVDSLGNLNVAEQIISSYDGSHNMTGQLFQIADSMGQWINSSKFIASFDSYNMITSSSTLDWDTANSGSWQPLHNRKHNYYYELYDPTIGIRDVQSHADAHIYPVPASGMLHIDADWQQAQPAIITIYDLTGRKVGEWPLPSASSYHGYVPVAGLTEGAYTMQVTGASLRINKSFNIIR